MFLGIPFFGSQFFIDGAAVFFSALPGPGGFGGPPGMLVGGAGGGGIAPFGGGGTPPIFGGGGIPTGGAMPGGGIEAGALFAFFKAFCA